MPVHQKNVHIIELEGDGGQLVCLLSVGCRLLIGKRGNREGEKKRKEGENKKDPRALKGLRYKD